MFADRSDAGKQLAERLAWYRGRDVVVMALARGGVPVGYEVGRALGAPLSILIARKLGVPEHSELAFGAVADGDHWDLVLNHDVIRELNIPDRLVRHLIAIRLREIRSMKKRLLCDRPRVDLAGRTVIIVDDGIATGATMRVAIQHARRVGARKVVVAAPVCARETMKILRKEADELVLLQTPAVFFAVGEFYDDFPQVDDEEVMKFLERANNEGGLKPLQEAV